MNTKRRKFLKSTLQTGTGLIVLPGLWSGCSSTDKEEDADEENTITKVAQIDTSALFFDISLAQWSLNESIFKGDMDNLDFAAKAKNAFGIDAVEYVNQFFKNKAEDKTYINQMKQRAEDNGVKSILIMIDNEGDLGDTNDKKRMKAVENHYKWVEAAKELGCHSIRVNARGNGTMEEVAAAAVEGLSSLSEFAKDYDINVIVENHGGYSSNGEWMAGVLKQVEMDNCGSLPDFGNFCIERSGGECKDMYDRYKGTTELMPYAKGVSAKTHEFDEAGNEVHTDYMKMMQIVKDAGYTGYVGIEYEGKDLSEDEGIRKTKELLLRVGQALS